MLAKNLQTKNWSYFLLFFIVLEYPELLDEGIAREVVSRIQKMRQATGLTPNDPIEVFHRVINPEKAKDLARVLVSHHAFITELLGCNITEVCSPSFLICFASFLCGFILQKQQMCFFSLLSSHTRPFYFYFCYYKIIIPNQFMLNFSLQVSNDLDCESAIAKEFVKVRTDLSCLNFIWCEFSWSAFLIVKWIASHILWFWRADKGFTSRTFAV